MSYTQEQLDGMTLTERVELAEQGKVPWEEVNRPEADKRRAAAEQAAIPINTRIASMNLCNSHREYLRRKHIRLHANRESRAATEALLKRSIEEDRAKYPHRVRSTIPLPRYNEV